MLDAIIADISHYRGKSIFDRLPETAPWTLEGCRKDLEGQRHGTLKGAARTLRGRAKGPRGPMASPLDDRAIAVTTGICITKAINRPLAVL